MVSSKICSTFASAFAQKTGLPQKAQAMIFERLSIHNKIVVQELIVKSMALRHETFTIEVPEKILHLINSIILSYLIISFTTKSLILAQDER